MLFSHIRAPLMTAGLQRFCNSTSTNRFEAVFSLPSIKYVALLNRLKVYHLYGTSLMLPSCGVMELANIIPESTFFVASYVGLTGVAVLSLASLPLKNIIGFLYINDDNSLIKISSVDFWGKRTDRIVKVDDWIPLLDLKQKKMDIVYLKPRLSDGTEYKLFVKFGNILNSTKIAEVLE